MRDVLLQRREETGLAAAHVVRLALGSEHIGAFAVELEEADENNDLELRVRGQRIPLVRRATSGSNLIVRNIARPMPREVPVALDAVADERGHGNTPVLPR